MAVSKFMPRPLYARAIWKRRFHSENPSIVCTHHNLKMQASPVILEGNKQKVTKPILLNFYEVLHQIISVRI